MADAKLYAMYKDGEVLKVNPTSVDQHLKLGWRLGVDKSVKAELEAAIQAENDAITMRQAEIDAMQAALDTYAKHEAPRRIAVHQSCLDAIAAG